MIRSKFESVWPGALLLGMVIIFFWDSFLDGKILFMRDIFCYYVPIRSFATQAALDGSLPFWNSYSAFGQPFLAEPLSALFYPFQFLYCLFPASTALKLSLALHLWIAALSMYSLSRSWKLDRLPSLLASICFTFGNFLIAYMEFQTFFNTIVWWPLSVFFFNMLIKVWEQGEEGPRKTPWAKSIPGTLCLALCLTVQFLAGHPEAFLLCGMLLFAYATARLLFNGLSRACLNPLSCLVISFALALGLVMYQLLPTLELIPHSFRSLRIDPGVETGSLHPRQLLMLIIPFLFGRPGYPDQWAEETVFEFWGAAYYIGLIPLMFASLSPFHRRSHTEASLQRFLFFFFASVSLFSFLMATGKHTGLYPFFHENVPFFNFFRQPCKWLLWSANSIPVLSAVGLQVIINERRRSRAGRPLVFLVVWAGWAILFLLLAGCYRYASQAPASFVQWITGGLWNPAGSSQLSGLLTDLMSAMVFFALGLIILGMFLFARGNWKKMGFLLLILLFGNLFFVSRQIHPIVEDDVYDCCSGGPKPNFQSSPYYRVHSIYSRGQQSLYGNKDPEIYRWACEALVSEIGLPARLFRTSVGGGLSLQGPLWIFASLDDFPYDIRERIADMLSIRYVIIGEPIDDILWGGASKGLHWIERPTWLPRAIIATTLHSAEDWRDALAQVLSPGFRPDREAVVELPLHELLCESSKFMVEKVADSPSGRLRSIQYTWNQIELEIDSVRGGLLVLNEAWYPGWQAWVDGRSQPVYRANGIFQGVFVGQGRHRVRFFYSPRLFYLGITVAGVTALLMLGLAWYWVRNSDRTERAGARAC